LNLVKARGRLVGEQDVWSGDERARDGKPLLLSSG
jgi:hypothetical protein